MDNTFVIDLERPKMVLEKRIKMVLEKRIEWKPKLQLITIKFKKTLKMVVNSSKW